MSFKSNADIQYIYEGLVTRSLPKSAWTHEAHFAAAIALLSKRKAQAFKDMPDLIWRYNEATGVQNTKSGGYHHTITLASLFAARDVLERSPGQELYGVVNTLLESEHGQSNWLLLYWTQDCLFSHKARKMWVSPDLKDLPFRLESFEPF